MEFKEGNLYKAKKDFGLIITYKITPKRLPVKRISEGTIITFLKWDKSWLTSGKLVKHFLIDGMVVADCAESYYTPEYYFEEVKHDQMPT